MGQRTQGIENKKKKKNVLLSTALQMLLTYVMIYVIAVVFAVFRLSKSESSAGTTSWWEVVQVVLFPLFFFLAGVILTKKNQYEKIAAVPFTIISFGFSVLILVLWYISLEASVLINLPVAQGGYAIDHTLRVQMVEVNNEFLYRSETDAYKFILLPLLYLFLDLFYWFCYYLGNRFCIRKEKKAK